MREWLEQQAATSILSVGDVAAAPASRRYRLPAGHQEVLLDRDSLNYLAALLRLVVGTTRPLPALLEAFRHGGGAPYADYGADTRDGIAEMNRPMFLNLLGTAWLPAVPDLHARLQSAPPARVADVGCGPAGPASPSRGPTRMFRWTASISTKASIRTARANLATTEVFDRVTFRVRDAADPGLAGQYDLVTAFETIHDMARPVEALQAMRGLVAARAAPS